ncbi:MAG: redoxin domain-containing protein [Acidobacteria bacterium]|nr:redoxin domain-containing protein [Acidobacteriota bacterium]
MCAALTLVVGGELSTPVRGRAASAFAQKRRAGRRTPAHKPASKSAQPLPEKPVVREINEAGLKALLDANTASGHRLLVNFWATWCEPCRDEFPDLVRVTNEFKDDKEFQFITISLDDVSEAGAGVPKFLQTMRATHAPAYLLNATDQDAAIALVDSQWHGELPATFLFGRKGDLFFKHTGRIKPIELRKAIDASEWWCYDDKK